MLRVTEPELMLNPEQVRAFQTGTKDYSIKSFLEFYKTYVGLEKGKIIDLGSGTGEYLLHLYQHYPNLCIVGYDGSEEMVQLARALMETSAAPVQIRHLNFNDIQDTADCVVSTNTLHHLHDPKVFWEAIKRISNRCLIMDIVRPDTNEQAELIVEQYASNEPELFKQDFYNSLLAAFSLEELVEQISDTQLKVDMIPGRFNTLKSFIVHGRLA